MPIDTVHPKVACRLDEWKTIRDFVAGTKEVKEAGDRYLPKLSKQKPDEYRAYKTRASFLGASGRTAEGMVGVIMRKPPQMVLKETGEKLKEDADLQGKGLVSYARSLIHQLSTVGRAGTLIDWSESESRPYFVAYEAEQIINWNVERINPDGKGGRMHLTLLVLKELHNDKTADEFAPKIEDAWRVFRSNGTGTTWEKYIRDPQDKKKFVKIEGGELQRKAKPVPEIPFIFHNADEPGPCPGKAPLADLVELNCQHYRQSADYNNGLHVAGLPTPYFFGQGATKGGDDDTTGGNADDALYLGTTNAWTSEDPNAKAGFVEFTGQGLGAIKESLDKIEEQMAAIGARLIEPRKADAESAETVGLRLAAEASTLSRVGLQATEGLVLAIAWAEWWTGAALNIVDASEGWTFELNKDFTSAAITAEMLTAWIGARTSGFISRETLHHNLQRGEAFPDGWSFEDEQDAIEANPPMPPPLPTPPLDPNTNDPETGEKRPNPPPVPAKKPPAKK